MASVEPRARMETRLPSPRSRGRRRRIRAAALAINLLISTACTAGGASGEPAIAQAQPGGGKGEVDDLVVVDCLLPGQVRRLGQRMTYLSPRRPAKVTARECAIRGGEYVAIDRANYQTALTVWKQSAEQGDVVAQTYVGEIFEKGLGGPPDYVAAAGWYRRAAEKGSSRAAINLGMLYERGLGVPKDSAQALSWYRLGAGIPNLAFETGPEVTALQRQLGEAQLQLKKKQEELERTQRELDSVRRRLEQQRSEADVERGTLDRLRRELQEGQRRDDASTAGLRELERSIQDREGRLAAKDRQIAEQKERLARLEAESAKQIAEQKDQLVRLAAESAQQRTQLRQQTPPPRGGTVSLNLPAGGAFSFGRYHALVIGNNDYPLFPPKRQLRTAVNDAKEVTRILTEQYGFKVTQFLNATRKDILTALNDLRARLTEDDNLLIYYAGHGEYDQINKRGYWVPVDAEPTSSTEWIPTFSITDTVNVMTARQVLIVADSCYAGSLALRGSVGQLEPGMSERQRVEVMQRMAQRPSRMLLASGGVEPVIDSRGGPHSIFSRFFIEALRDNAGVLAGYEVFRFLSPPVTAEAQHAGIQQTPEYSALPFAGHEGGDFFFVRTRSRM